MTKQEYADYEKAVASFMEREGINCLSSGHLRCPDCNAEWTNGDKCPNGHGSRDLWNEAFFSWQPCECCGDRLGGNREHASGYNPKTNEIHEYDRVCEDCVYYAAYGRLNDTTMLEMEG